MVDRAWSRALIQHMDITPVVAAMRPCGTSSVWSRYRTWCDGDFRSRPPSAISVWLTTRSDGCGGGRTVLGEDLIDGLGAEPLSEDELVALFRRRDLVANPAVAQAIATAVLRSASSGPWRLLLVKRVTLELFA